MGKKATRQIRSQELVPGVIYGGAQEVNFSAPAKAFKPLVYTPNFQLADVTVDGKTYRCILKDLQFDKVSDELIHIDLLELVEDVLLNRNPDATERLTKFADSVKQKGKVQVAEDAALAFEAARDLPEMRVFLTAILFGHTLRQRG